MHDAEEDAREPESEPLGDAEAPPGGGPAGAAAEPAAQEPSEAASKLDMALDDIGGEISREPAICRYFTSAGGCIYGDNCWFSHVLPAPAPPAAPDSQRRLHRLHVACASGARAAARGVTSSSAARISFHCSFFFL